MNFNDILDSNHKGNLILGHEDDHLLSVNLDECSSIIITGSTGTGKSVLLNQILLELINNYTSLEMGMMLLDTSGVELNRYQATNYALFSAINDLDKANILIARVIKEMDRRRELVNNLNVSDVNEYNEKVKGDLPLLVIAIDDDKLFLRNPDINRMITSIISGIKGLNMLFILATSDNYSKFFKQDNNTLADLLISFDYQDEKDEEVINIPDTSDLIIGRFKSRYRDEIKEYNNFNFEDTIIDKILNDKNTL